MFQSFEDTADGSAGPARLAAVRDALAGRGLDGFLVPRADAHQGEYVAPRDDRLAWLTGFTGSAGWCAVLQDKAAVFVDGRYRVQVRAQVADVFTPVDWPETGVGGWLDAAAFAGARIGFDPWLVTPAQLDEMQKDAPAVVFVPSENVVDAVWVAQPAAPLGPVKEQHVELTGVARNDKIASLSGALNADAAVLTLPDSIAWLLNIRGADIPRNPVAHGFAILHAAGRVSLFMDGRKLGMVDLGPLVDVQPPDRFLTALSGLSGRVRVDPATAPLAVQSAVQAAGAEVVAAPDPCLLPKARKTEVEIEGARAAHLRDGAAMVRFLAWLDAQPPGSLTEIDVVERLEGERRATNALCDISFETISGAGPNGAIVHYRVTRKTNRRVEAGQLLLVDSGGQYVDGTTDITRTVAIGDVGEEERDAFTRVLQGMIGISRLRWPAGLAGRDLDAVARLRLWEAGLDYGHGTGHGIGSYLCVHEGPHRLARASTVPFEPGMMLSNEPGFYREGRYGIRIENLIVVREAAAGPGQTIRSLLEFETLTWVPIDRRLIVTEHLTAAERDWVNAYHAEVLDKIGPLVSGTDRDWLTAACALL